jgi:hypothetical protein
MLGNGLKVSRQLNAVAAGTTSQNGSGVDMQGWDGVVFICAIGTLTATQVTSLKAQGDTAAGFGTAADIAGTSTGPYADADGNKLLVLDIYRPIKRYIRPVVVRGTANAVIDGVIAIQYKGAKSPLPAALEDSTLKTRKVLASPADGTP